MCAPTFTSSDWSAPIFVMGYATNVMYHASEMYASEGKTEKKSWTQKLVN